MSSRLGIWFGTDGMTAQEAVAFAQRIESLGYASLWLPETFGRDPFVHLAHLGEAKVRIDRALDAQYIYNTNDIGGGGGMPFIFFGEEDE